VTGVLWVTTVARLRLVDGQANGKQKHSIEFLETRLLTLA